MFVVRLCVVLNIVLLITLFVDRGHGKRLNRFKRAQSNKPPKVNCKDGEWKNLAYEESIQFSLDQEQCDINVLGSKAEKCTAEITCDELNFEEPDENGVCQPESYMEVRDSLGGSMKFCGNKPFGGPYRASKNGRDLYIYYVGNSPGTICHVICAEDQATHEFEALWNNGARDMEESCVCGKKSKKLGRVVGGEHAEAFEFPWMAAIAYKRTRLNFCGGSLINDRYILSAAHCFAYKLETLPAEVDVLLHVHVLDLNTNHLYKPNAKAGETGSIVDVPGLNLKNFTDAEEKTLRLEVEEIYVHPFWSTKTLDYDIALLKLKEPLDLKDSSLYNPICLPPEGKFFNYGNKTALVSGWGKFHETAGAASRILQKLDMPVLFRKPCWRMLSSDMTPRMLCAGHVEGGKDSCTGDSGGPLVFKFNAEQYRQIGVVSWGYGCAQPASPSVYTNVQEVIQWIYHFTQDAIWCLDNKYVEKKEEFTAQQEYPKQRKSNKKLTNYHGHHGHHSGKHAQR